jgi:hypothetical protein
MMAPAVHAAHASNEPQPFPITGAFTVTGGTAAALTRGDDPNPSASTVAAHTTLRKILRIILHLTRSSFVCPRTPRAMGPDCRLFVWSPAGRNAVEWNERLAGPESHEPIGRDHIVTGGWIEYFNGTVTHPSRDDYEMRFLHPDERWDRQVRDIGGVPSHGEHAQSRAFGGGSKIAERGSGWLNVSRAAEGIGGWHRNAREFKEIRERSRAAVI